MTIGGIKPGDIVLVDKKGRKFFAEVTGKEEKTLKVKPMSSNVTYHEATAREVKRHYRLLGRGNGHG